MTTNGKPRPPMRTFYRRELPPSCAALSSEEGRSLFASAMSHSGLKTFFPLIEQFTTQTEPAFCGPSTLVVILNALSVDPRRTWKGPWRWYEESMLNCCVDLEVVKKTGITFSTFVCLARCQGLDVNSRLASDSSVDEFRRAVRESCVSTTDSPSSEDRSFLVVSYSRRVVGQTGDGHFSPVAAYDEVSDSVLILDTARFKYGPHWVPLPLLFEAMVPVDKDSGKSRGYALLSFNEEDLSSDHPLQSIMFRSKKSNDPIRREYKNFLKSRSSGESVSFHEVESFWTKDGKDPRFIWGLVEPQLMPVDKQEAQMVEELGELVRRLLDNIPRVNVVEGMDECCGDRCGKSAFRKVPVTGSEAILVAYLASLPPGERKALIDGEAGAEGISDDAREQLIREAELVQYAIDMSCKEELN